MMMMIAIGMLVFVWVMARLPRMKGCGQVIHLWVTLINVRIDGSVETQRIVRWWAISVVAIRMTDGRRIVYTQVSKLYTSAPTGLWPNLSRFKGQVQAEIAPCTRRTVFVGKLNFGQAVSLQAACPFSLDLQLVGSLNCFSLLATRYPGNDWREKETRSACYFQSEIWPFQVGIAVRTNSTCKI